ncbi:MAG: DHH family phosphoesterase [Bacteroidia bacterium]
MNNIAELKPLLLANTKPKIVITTHHKPDADALGSSLGLYNFLLQLNITSQVITPTDYGVFLNWMPGEKTVINFEEETELATQMVADADFIFCLDFNALKRINLLGDLVAKSAAKKVMIDHHLEPENFDDYRLWTSKASSTCELIYWFIQTLQFEHLVNKEIASCLYAGIMTDTASFKHGSTTPTTHRVAAELLEKGAESNLIFENIYDNYSENRTRFIGFCLNERMQILPEYKTAIILVSAEDLEKYNIIVGDSEGLVNYGLSIEGIKFSILVVDRTIARKMSFRAKGNFPANEFARKYFNGGGHFSAAGGESKDTLENIEIKLKNAIKEYAEYLK